MLVLVLAISSFAAPACESPRACYEQGRALTGAQASAPDVERGVALIDAACADGVAEACAYRGQLLATGPDARLRALDAIALRERACELSLQGSGEPESRRDAALANCAWFARSTRALDPADPQHVARALDLRDAIQAGAYLQASTYSERIAAELWMSKSRVLCATWDGVTSDDRAKECAIFAGMVRADARGVARAWPEIEIAPIGDLEARLCDAGLAAGCSLHGATLALESGDSAKVARGVDLMESACWAGDHGACYQVEAWHGRCDTTSSDRTVCDPMGARARASQACSDLGAPACRVAAELDALIARRSTVDALGKACARGGSHACVDLTNTAPAGPELVATLERACSKRHGSGCFELATTLLVGQGVDRDLARASAAATRVCETQGVDTAACQVLIESFDEGAW